MNNNNKNRVRPRLLHSIFIAVIVAACGGGSSPQVVTPPIVNPAPSEPTTPVVEEPTPVIPEFSQTIVVDQFGYLPTATKVAVLRNPQVGYDNETSYEPSLSIELVNTVTGEVVLDAAPVEWSNGNTDESSGDKAWWFDFSSVTTPGRYEVVDAEHGVKSASFDIRDNVYLEVLKHAFRTFYYQRAGVAKEAPYAPEAWQDSASHIAPGQDSQARLYSTPNDATTERDLSGGWYDAGDYNKYTSWTANYIVTLLHAYIENPSAWGDNFNIPESNNGMSDLLDEVKWGLAWLMKMQDGAEDGAVLSIVGLDHASPPSAAKGSSYYGPANTSATLSTASAFALASQVYAALPDNDMLEFSNDLKERAEQAWQWADAHPRVVFKNNDSATGSAGLGAGQQEVDDDGRAKMKRSSAIYLFAATGKPQYQTFIDANYQQSPLIAWGQQADPFRQDEINALLYYAALGNTSPEVASDINTAYKNALDKVDNLAAIESAADPFRAYLPLGHYTWGSNRTKAEKASMFTNLSVYNLAHIEQAKIDAIALDYLHYLHGVNPQSKVYLSNMYDLGVQNSVDEFYHAWFDNGSELWDRVGESTYGPAPGFLVGGPNPHYDWDNQCKGSSPHALCGDAAPTPPKGQPAQKAYKDFNTSWPINSWAVTENSCGYQVSYLRVLSKFVND